ncbi:MAG: hypothetical protein Q9160_008286 [Pyrenula sp. 1 TL-2023]
MRLTVDLIQSSLSYLNPLKERELDLRGHKIPLIENLASSNAVDHDAIDFTDNDISSLANFPFAPRIKTLLLARNRINQIQRNLATQLPNLHTLVLTGNRIAELADVTEALRGCQRLRFLSLGECPVERKEHYRLFLIWRLPTLRFLDYNRIRDVERQQATELFGGDPDAPTLLASKILNVKSRTFDPGVPSAELDGTRGGVGGGKALRVKLTEQERKRVQKMIREAKDLREITRLERELREGRVPGGAAGGGGPGEAMEM